MNVNSPSANQPWLDLIARILVAAVFINYGVLQILRFGFYVSYMAKFNVPSPDILLPLGIILEIGGGVLLVLGWKTRWAVAALALFTLVATVAFHRYWEMDQAAVAVNMANFFKNLAILGAFAHIFIHGAGPLSIDAKANKTAR
jgi:putative oxidoreductase